MTEKIIGYELVEKDFELWSGTEEKGSFLKLKNGAFPIGKVKFCFGNTGAHKTLADSVDIYMDFEEALGFAEQIFNGRVEGLLLKGQTGYSASIGGGESGGKVIQRSFCVEKAMKETYAACITAYSQPAKAQGKGIFAPLEGSRKTYFRVPVTRNGLFEMAAWIRLHCTGFMNLAYASAWREVTEDRKNRSGEQRTRQEKAVENLPDAVQEKPQVQASGKRTVVQDFYFQRAKGCEIFSRGMKNEITVLRLVTPALDDEGEFIFTNRGRNWQIVDVVFYDANLERTGYREKLDEIRELIGEGADGVRIPNLKNLEVKVLDVKDGYRQTIFQREIAG